MADYPHEYQYIIKDFTLISHTGLEINIWPQVYEFSFQETIFGRCLHGSISVVESLDLPTILPMIGEEKIRVSFTRLNEVDGLELDPIQFELPIYCLRGKLQEGKSGKRQTYTLNFCSEAIYKNINSVVSKAFKNMTYTEMVREIYETHLKVGDKDIEIEETSGVMNYTVQNQRAIKALCNIANRAKSANAENGTYFVFFEDREKFYFYTMKGLLKKGMEDQSKIRKLYYGIKNLPEPDGALKDLSVSMYNAEVVEEQNSGFDILHSAQQGEGASSLLTIDPIRRSFSFKTLDLRGEEVKQDVEKSVDSPAPLEFLPNSDFSAIAGQNAKKPWTNKSKIFVNPRANMKVIIGDAGQDTQEYIAARDPQVKPYNPEDFAAQKTSERRQFFRRPITTTIPGDPRIKPGTVIFFAIPEKKGNIRPDNPQELDKYLQGHYLVVGVAHIINKEKYRMNLELMRPSDDADIKPEDPFKIYGALQS